MRKFINNLIILFFKKQEMSALSVSILFFLYSIVIFSFSDIFVKNFKDFFEPAISFFSKCHLFLLESSLYWGYFFIVAGVGNIILNRLAVKKLADGTEKKHLSLNVLIILLIISFIFVFCLFYFLFIWGITHFQAPKI